VEFKISVWIRGMIILILENWLKIMVYCHIKSRGEENIRKVIPGFRARRWVVEKTHFWLNRFRRLYIRWETKIENYLATLHFACAWITFRAAGLFDRL
jgi:transposase